MASINPYLLFDGDCEAAFAFYKSAFGGEFTFMGRFKDMPPAEGQPPMNPADADRVMHVSLPISKETILMGSDCQSEMPGYTHTVGTNMSISINTESKDEADKLFNALSAGGKITMPMEQTFWGAYFGMFDDKFGIQWMVNFDEPQK
ncbi:MAG: VOC family protein [Flavobacterium sp.]|nr:MAG: VOC family protein [Flavobacterium sp.]